MTDFVDFLTDLTLVAGIRRHPYVFVGIALSGLGVFLLLGPGLRESATAAVIYGGLGVLLSGILLSAIGVWKWFHGK